MNTKYFYLALLLFTCIACAKKDSDPQIVAKFVAEVKTGNYLSQQLPDFKTSHIYALFRHASDEQLIDRYPWSPILSYYPGQKEVGFVVLYAIEVIRNPGDYPHRGAHVLDADNRERKVSLDEVLSLYQAWWAQHKGKSALQLRQLNPLEGTSLVWFGTEAPE